jgi:hypothetical protein
MEHCNICNINILKKNFKRHELSQKHSDNKNKRKRKFEQLKREVLSEFDTLERNHEDISPQEIKKELKKVFTNIITNKRKFETTYFENDEYKVIKSEEALEGCFLALRIEPKINIDNIEILI